MEVDTGRLPLQSAKKKVSRDCQDTYCWWKKFCTSWYGESTIIYKVLSILGGCLGFLNHQLYFYIANIDPGGGDMGYQGPLACQKLKNQLFFFGKFFVGIQYTKGSIYGIFPYQKKLTKVNIP